MFKCPFCEFKAESFWNLKHHVAKKHVNGSCPVCGEEFRSVRKHVFHHALRGDYDHIVLYGLIASHRGRVTNLEFRNDCRDIACEECEVV